MFAGADTTASTVSAGFFHILKSQHVLNTLISALHDAKLSFPINYNDVKEIPYLEAVIQETLRIHPAVGMLLERVVPPEGFTLSDGTFLPHGICVGVNPYVVNRNDEIFEQDAETFKPDRWLKGGDESDKSFRARRKRMENTMFIFGGGN